MLIGIDMLGVQSAEGGDRESGRFLTAIIPTFEAHISDPLNHRGVKSPDPAKNYQYDPYGTPDTVNGGDEGTTIWFPSFSVMSTRTVVDSWGPDRVARLVPP